MGNLWGNDGETMGKYEKIYGKTIGKKWEKPCLLLKSVARPSI